MHMLMETFEVLSSTFHKEFLFKTRYGGIECESEQAIVKKGIGNCFAKLF